MSLLLTAVLMSLPVATEAPAEGGRPSLLVLSLQPAGVEPNDAKILDGMVANALSQHDAIDVVTAEELAQMMELEGQRQSVGCDDTSCLGEIAGAMGARYVIFGKAGRLGELFVVQLNLFDSIEAKAVGRQEIQAKALEDLAPRVQPAVDALVAQVTGAPVVQKAAPEEAPVERGFPFVVVGAGVGTVGALLAGGGGLAFALFLSELSNPDSGKDAKNAAAGGAPISLAIIGGGAAVMVAGAVTAAVGVGVE